MNEVHDILREYEDLQTQRIVLIVQLREIDKKIQELAQKIGQWQNVSS